MATTRHVLHRTRCARLQVSKEISANGADSRVASAMASEGWAGGYCAALDDMLAVLTNTPPADPRGYWGKRT